MYDAFFGFREPPFALSPDPQFLWLSDTHQEALSALYYGITSRAGFILLTGEVGAGKTTILRACLDHLPHGTVTAMVFNTADIGPNDLLTLVLADLGIRERGPTKSEKLISLHEYLLRQLEAQTNIVVVIDEAQNLSEETLEEVRLLSNFETDKAKLLQLVLTGQPELLDKLATPQLRQLRQRIVVDHHVDYLKAEEIGPYLRHRVARAGADFDHVFEAGCELEFHSATRGCPRLLNLLAHKALLAAYTQQIRPVPRALVRSKRNSLPLIQTSTEPDADTVVAMPVGVGRVRSPQDRD